MQPLLFVFVFAYVFPKIGQGFRGSVHRRLVHDGARPGPDRGRDQLPGHPGGRAPARAGVQLQQGDRGPRARAGARVDGRIREDRRRRAPVAASPPVVVFPIVYLVHAQRRRADRAHPRLCRCSWPRSSSRRSSPPRSGLFIGTVIDPRKITLLFSVVVLPLTFLGCVYYPWATLSPIPWLQYLVLLNPLVYMTEGLRASLTPQLPHMAGVGVRCSRWSAARSPWRRSRSGRSPGASSPDVRPAAAPAGRARRGPGPGPRR